jgi:hypothetical protein
MSRRLLFVMSPGSPPVMSLESPPVMPAGVGVGITDGTNAGCPHFIHDPIVSHVIPSLRIGVHI